MQDSDFFKLLVAAGIASGLSVDDALAKAAEAQAKVAGLGY